MPQQAARRATAPQATATGERWVCLDVGETLIDETRVWTCWAEVLGVTPLTLMAALGAAIAEGEFRDAFEILGRPEWRELAPKVELRYGGFREGDLYPDALGAIDGLRALGYRVAVLANQPARRSAELRALGVEVEVMAMSEELGEHKPDPEFYRRALALLGDPDPADVAYVGDRADNDIRPAAAAGLRAVWLRRGPWALICGGADEAVLSVGNLYELVERIDECWPDGDAR